MDADHCVRWAQIFGYKVSELETSGPVENAIFTYPTTGVIPSEFRRDLLHHKTILESVGYCAALFFQILFTFSCFDTIPACDTHEKTANTE